VAGGVDNDAGGVDGSGHAVGRIIDVGDDAGSISPLAGRPKPVEGQRPVGFFQAKRIRETGMEEAFDRLPPRFKTSQGLQPSRLEAASRQLIRAFQEAEKVTSPDVVLSRAPSDAMKEQKNQGRKAWHRARLCCRTSAPRRGSTEPSGPKNRPGS